jgi:cyanophycinase-like exopeptidase
MSPRSRASAQRRDRLLLRSAVKPKNRMLLVATVALGALGAPLPPINGTHAHHHHHGNPWPWHKNDGVVRVVVGGGGANSIWRPDSDILELFRGYPAGGVKVITAAGTNCESSGASLVNSFANAGVEAEWIPICDNYCDTAAFDPEVVAMVDRADAIFYGGGQSGRLQSCLYGDYSQSGIDVEEGATTPILEALIRKEIVGGSSAGAMNQPMSEILVTGHSVESYAAVSGGGVFQRNRGNMMLDTEELVDTHFSERGRQGRLMMIAMNTNQRWAFGIDEDAACECDNRQAAELISGTLYLTHCLVIARRQLAPGWGLRDCWGGDARRNPRRRGDLQGRHWHPFRAERPGPLPHQRCEGERRPDLRDVPFYSHEIRSFPKTGSGQTSGKESSPPKTAGVTFRRRYHQPLNR